MIRARPMSALPAICIVFYDSTADCSQVLPNLPECCSFCTGTLCNWGLFRRSCILWTPLLIVLQSNLRQGCTKNCTGNHLHLQCPQGCRIAVVWNVIVNFIRYLQIIQHKVFTAGQLCGGLWRARGAKGHHVPPAAERTPFNAPPIFGHLRYVSEYWRNGNICTYLIPWCTIIARIVSGWVRYAWDVPSLHQPQDYNGLGLQRLFLNFLPNRTSFVEPSHNWLPKCIIM